jgi:hypothetical protein
MPTESTLHIRLVHHKPNFQADLNSTSTPKLFSSILPQTQGLGLGIGLVYLLLMIWGYRICRDTGVASPDSYTCSIV